MESSNSNNNSDNNNPAAAAMYTPDVQVSKMEKKSEHILVFARVRPMNNHERSKNAVGVLDCPGSREVVVREKTNLTAVSKTFTFDRVFGPHSKQIDVYKAVVSPLLEEVLQGYNCTVFAYGQTGTGKTFTMEGDRTTQVAGEAALTWESDPLAGIVPRAMSQLFDELRVANAEFTVRVSLVEMYNEEVYDLLSPTEDSKPKTVRLYEDSSRKGSVHIQGLEEVIVRNKHEVYAIMERGSQMRKTASTLLNANSSRSHTVFTVTVHIKEASLMGEDLLKIGKLHLVDLAGSENIGRSGAIDKRAREAGNINQSLLTLGRVITALVERAPHIPYRESKLTRLLQDSLGGRTKTSIIATVSPASINMEETLSTLDYAHRAKNITNRPEVNQKLTKKAMLKEYTEEIERLRRDLLAAREKNGIYVDKENYDHMVSQIESQSSDLSEKIQYTKSLEEQVKQKEAEVTDVKAVLEETTDDLNNANAVIDSLRSNVLNLTVQLYDTKTQKEEMEHLVKVQTDTESKLTKEATTLLHTAAESTVNLDTLYNRLERKKNVEAMNRENGRRFRGDFDEQLKNLASDIKVVSEEHSLFSGTQRMKMEEFLTLKKQQLAQLYEKMSNFDNIVKIIQNQITETADEQDLSNKEVSDELEEYIKTSSQTSKGNFKSLKDIFLSQTSELRMCFKHALEEVDSIFNEFRENIQQENTLLNDYVTSRLESFAEQLACVKNLATVTKSHQETFLSTYQTRVDLDRQKLAEVSSKANSAIEELQALVKENLALQQNLNEEHDWVCEQTEKQTMFVVQSGQNVMKKLNSDQVETTALPLKMKKLEDTLITAVDKKVLQVSSLQDENTQVILKMEQGLDEVLTKEKVIWQDLKTKTSSKLNENESELSIKTQKLREINNQLIVKQDEQTGAIKQDVQEGLEADRNHVETGRADVFKNCDNVSRSTEDFQQRLHMQSGKLNEFWDSTYLIDLPTGATPQRKAYDFPRNLSATSPHDRILGRYRNFRLRLGSLNDSDSEAVLSEREASPACSVASDATDTPRSMDDGGDENKSPADSGVSSSNETGKLGNSGGSMAPPVAKIAVKGLTRSASDLSKGQPTNPKMGSGKKNASAEQVNKRVDKKIPVSNNGSGSASSNGKRNKKVLQTPN